MVAGTAVGAMLLSAASALANNPFSRVYTEATLRVSDGPRITDTEIEQWLAYYIPESSKRFLLFTECYGGDAVQKFIGSENTVAVSASGQGMYSNYLGYCSAVASALAPCPPE